MKTEASKQRNRECMRARRAAHPELISARSEASKRKNTEAARAYRAANPGKAAAAALKYRLAHPERTLARHRKYRLDHPEKILAAGRKWGGMPEPTRECPQVCEGCGGLPGSKALSLDHDHETGAFRGWLCTKCNTGLGMLGDSLDKVLRIVDYLRRNTLDP
jgi:hypothetical protein